MTEFSLLSELKLIWSLIQVQPRSCLCLCPCPALYPTLVPIQYLITVYQQKWQKKKLHDTSEKFTSNKPISCMLKARPLHQGWISVLYLKLWNTPTSLCLEVSENKNTSCVNGSLLILHRLLSVSVVWRATKSWRWWYIMLQSQISLHGSEGIINCI